MGRTDHDSPRGMFGVLAGAGLCCGLPLLLGTSFAIGTLALLAGSILLGAAAIGLGVWAWRRRPRSPDCDPDSATQRRDTCGRADRDRPNDVANKPTETR